MKPRTVLQGQEAQDFYDNATGWRSGEGKYTFDHDLYQSIGGYYREGDGWVAYDFTSGNEVFIEEFDKETEAIKYASGIIAVTKGGMEI